MKNILLSAIAAVSPIVGQGSTAGAAPKPSEAQAGNTALVLEQTINAPVARVWSAWTDPQQVAPWLSLKANVEPVRGGAYELFWDPEHLERNSTLGCRVTFITPMKWLGFTWRGPAIYDDLMNESANPPPPPTHVTVTFKAEGERTTVRLEHVGWGEGARWSEARAWHAQAWNAAFANLAAYVEGRSLPVDWGNPAQ